MTRAQIPEQQEARQIMREWQRQHDWITWPDIAREMGIPISSLRSWVNGRQKNLLRHAYADALAQWVERHESEVT